MIRFMGAPAGTGLALNTSDALDETAAAGDDQA